MKKEIVVKRVAERIRSCNSCGARNYTPSIGHSDGCEKVEELHELCISTLCVALCENCMREVAEKINEHLTKTEAE